MRRPLHLFALIVLILLVTELGIALLIPKVSAIESRVNAEYRGALQVRPGQTGSPTVLVVGNSLLLHAVDMASLQREVGPSLALQRLVVEDTTYWDWYFGLENLLQKGARPDAIIYMLSPRQLTAQYVRGAYSAYHLLSPRQIPRLAAALDMSVNQEAELLIASVSAAYGLRYEYRNVIFSKAVPGADAMADIYARAAQKGRTQAKSDTAINQLIAERFSALNKLCSTYHVATCTFLPAPTLSQEPLTDEAVAIYRTTMPSVPDLHIPHDYAREEFERDGYHMSEKGKAIYTHLLAERLRQGSNLRPSEPGKTAMR